MAYVLSDKAARALTRIVRGNAANTTTTYDKSPVAEDDYPLPFAVRWSASETANGTWVIWLPGAATIVSYDGAYIPSIGGITAAQRLPSGYYTIDDLTATSTAVYLNVTVTESTGVATARLSGSASSASAGQRVYSLLVATMATDQTTGAKTVKQFIDSAVIIGGGSGGSSVIPDDVSTEFIQSGANIGKLQIKGFEDGTPVPSTDLATELAATSNIAKVLTRAADGTLQYMPIGHFTGGLPTNTVCVVTGDDYGYYNNDYRIRIATQPLGIDNNGQFALGATTYSYIDTVALSAEWVTP